MENNKIKIGIIGIGYWGPNLVRNFNQLKNVEIASICDLNLAKLENIKGLYSPVKFTENFRDILQDPEIKAVVIATPLKSHFELVKEALLASKDVLVEKPMTESTAKAEELVKLAKEKSRILMVDHTFIYSGAIQKIKDLIVKGELGELYYFDSERINLGLIRSDADVIFDLAVHDLAIIDYLFPQKPLAISAFSWGHILNKEGESADINIRHESGFVSSVRASWLSPVKIRKIIIAGSKKMLMYDDVEPDEKIRIYDKGIDVDPESVTPFQPLYRSGDIIIPKIDQTETLKSMAEHFIACVRERKQPLTDGQAGLRVVSLIETIKKSINEKGREINLL